MSVHSSQPSKRVHKLVSLCQVVNGTSPFSFPFLCAFLDRFKQKQWHYRFRFVFVCGKGHLNGHFLQPVLDCFLNRFVLLAGGFPFLACKKTLHRGKQNRLGPEFSGKLLYLKENWDQVIQLKLRDAMGEDEIEIE